jgi:hypothetical protein
MPLQRTSLRRHSMPSDFVIIMAAFSTMDSELRSGAEQRNRLNVVLTMAARLPSDFVGSPTAAAEQSSASTKQGIFQYPVLEHQLPMYEVRCSGMDCRATKSNGRICRCTKYLHRQQRCHRPWPHGSAAADVSTSFRKV